MTTLANTPHFQPHHYFEVAHELAREAGKVTGTLDINKPPHPAITDLVGRMAPSSESNGLELVMLPTEYQAVAIRHGDSVVLVLYKVKDPDWPEEPAVTVGLYLNNEGNLDGDPFECARSVESMLAEVAGNEACNLGTATAFMLALESMSKGGGRTCQILQKTAEVLTARLN